MIKPSTGRVLVLFCLALLIFSLQFTQYADYDLWWHLKLGESIVRTGAIYDADAFSYTFAGQHQTSSEWLSDLVLYLAHAAGGLTGLGILKAVVVSLALFFVFLTILNECEDTPWRFTAAVVTVVIVLFALRFRLFIRPYLFNYLFVAVVLYLLSRYRSRGSRKTLLLLPLLQVVWSNMYSTSVFGPMILTFFIIGALFDPQRRRDTRTLIPVLAAVVLASLISPEGYRSYVILFQISTDPTISKFGEFQPLSLPMLWGYGFRYTFAYQALVTGSLAYFLFLKGWRNVFHVLLFAVFFAETILHVRMIDVFSLVTAAFFASAAGRLLNAVPLRDPDRPAMTAATAVLLLALVPLSIVNSRSYPFGTGVKEDAFPEKAIAFLEKEKVRGVLFNSYSFGGYLIWRAPDRKVFIDGRYSRPYTADFYNAYREALESREAWNAAERRWGFDYALLEYDLMSRQFPLHLNSNPAWALVYWDRTSAIYLKRTPQNEGTIARHAYRVVKPAFYDFRALEHSFGSQPPDRSLLDQIDHDIALNPQNQEPRLAKAFVLFSLGPAAYRSALAELLVTLSLKPDLAMEHSAAAYLLHQSGMVEEARRETRKALELDPEDAQAKELKNRLFKD